LQRLIAANPNLPANMRQQAQQALDACQNAGVFDITSILALVEMIVTLIQQIMNWTHNNPTPAPTPTPGPAPTPAPAKLGAPVGCFLDPLWAIAAKLSASIEAFLDATPGLSDDLKAKALAIVDELHTANWKGALTNGVAILSELATAAINFAVA
jgi:hypothetical protein